jgi:hypothetical protein
MNVWDWGNQTIEPTASAMTPPTAHCSACLVELAEQGMPAFYVEYMQRLHHQMWFRVGEPPGTLVAWQVQLIDWGGKVNPDGTPVTYPACIYAVLVDWWNEDWPQRRLPWSLGPASHLLVVLGARVVARPDTEGRHTQGSWIFRWLWPNPAWPETCLLDPPHAYLTDAEAVRLNHARRAFYAWRSRRGAEEGSGKFGHSEDFRQAVVSAILALRADRQRVSKAAIGRHIGRIYEPSYPGDDRILKDPGNQVRRWEKKFGVDVDVLIRRTPGELEPGH